jgi:hypothetical protein
MPDAIHIDFDNKLIRIESTGLLDVTDMCKSIEEIQRINMQTGINKVIVDATNLEQLPPETHIHSIVKDLTKLPTNMMYAILSNGSSLDGFSYFKAVAKFKGLIFEVFTNKDMGESWLKGKSNLK